MTGDTANGRSMSVIKALLPRKLNLAIAHAAATPNTRLQGTAMAATYSVSLTAVHATGSDMATKYAPMPLASACTNTSATAINTRRAGPCPRPLDSASAAAMSRQGPVLQGVDSEHQCEGQDQH